MDTVNLTDTFEIWRQKTNDVIGSLNILNDPITGAALKSETLLLDVSSQTVLGSKSFRGGLIVSDAVDGATLSYDNVSLSMLVNKSITTSNELKAASLNLTGSSTSINGVSYNWPNASNDGYLRNVAGTLTFQSYNDLLNSLTTNISSQGVTLMAELLPVGTISAYDGRVLIPTGWLECNGSPVDRALYPDLADALAVAPEATSFTLPDLRGKIPIGKTGSQTLGDTIGTLNDADDNDYYVVRYIIKAKKDNTTYFSITSGNGIKLSRSSDPAQTTLDLSGGSVELKANLNQFSFDTLGQLNIKTAGIANDRLASASNTPTPNSVAIRSSTSQLKVPGTPIAADDAASKQYVDASQNLAFSYSAVNARGCNSYSAGAPYGAVYIDAENNVVVYGEALGGRRFGYEALGNRAGDNINNRYGSIPKRIYCDWNNTYVLYNDNRVESLGYNVYYKSGSTSTNADEAILTRTQRAFGSESISEVILSYDYDSQGVYAINTNGELWAAGRNDYGQLGNNSTTSLSYNSSTAIPFKTIVKAETVGGTALRANIVKAWLVGRSKEQTGFALDNGGTLWACGYGAYGQTGRLNSNSINKNWMPVLKRSAGTTISGVISSGTTYTTPSAHGLSLYDKIRVSSAGSSVYYTVRPSLNDDRKFTAFATDDSAFENTGAVSVPITSFDPFSRLTNVSNAYFGGALNRTFGFAKLESGALFGWGNNTYGQLGITASEIEFGARSTRSSGTTSEVYTDIGWTVHLVDATGKLFATGDNRRGQLGTDLSLSSVANWTPVTYMSSSWNNNFQIHKFFSASLPVTNSNYILTSKFALVKKLKSGSTTQYDYFLFGWGNNEFGQLGIERPKGIYNSPRPIYFAQTENPNISEISCNLWEDGIFSTILVKRLPVGGEDPDLISGELYTAGQQVYNHNGFPNRHQVVNFTRVKHI